MYQMRTVRSFVWFRFLICVLAALLLFSPITAVAAPEDAESVEQTGWMEVKAYVPEGFKAQAILSVINDETGEEFDVQILAANNYVGRLELPAGDYSVSSAFVLNDYRYELQCTPSTFSVKGNNDSAAPLVEVTITDSEEFSEGASLPAIEEEVETMVSPSTDNEIQDETVSEPLQEEEPIVDASEEEEEEEEPEEAPEPENKFLKILRVIGINLLGTAVFVGIVCAVVYFVRKRLD